MFSCWDGTVVMLRGDSEVRAGPTAPAFRNMLKESSVPFYCPAADVELKQKTEQGRHIYDPHGKEVEDDKKVGVGPSAASLSVGLSVGGGPLHEDAEEDRPPNAILAEDPTVVLVQGPGPVAAFLDMFRSYTLRAEARVAPLPAIFSSRPFANATRRSCEVRVVVQETGGSSMSGITPELQPLADQGAGPSGSDDDGVCSGEDQKSGSSGAGGSNAAETTTSGTHATTTWGADYTVDHTIIAGVLFPEQVERFLTCAMSASWCEASLKPHHSSLGPRTFGFLSRGKCQGDEGEAGAGALWNVELTRVRKPVTVAN